MSLKITGKRQDRLQEELKNAPDNLRQLLKEIEHRCIGVENSAPEDDKRHQRKELMLIVQVIIL